MNDLDAILSNYERDRQARAKLSEGNKGAVCDALMVANVTQVRVEFDGEGDSGQISAVTALRGDEHADLPAAIVTIQQVAWGDTNVLATQRTLADAIETLCYDYLEETHGGWENDGGAYGEFCIDVAARTVELEFNARFTDVFTSNHSF
jgi:Family of unknown function (DUF6878)